MAPSTISGGGWGVFAGVAIDQHAPVLHDDPILNLFDRTSAHEAGLSRLLHDYAWYGFATFSSHEAASVHSVWPGLSMLSNGHRTQFNVVPDVSHYRGPTIHSADFGARTYYSAQYYAYQSLPEGSELFVSYGTDYQLPEQQSVAGNRQSIATLQETGWCLDGIRPGPSQGLGRGAFATRHFAVGDVVAVAPVLPVSRSSLEGELLLNYCYGHVGSDMLLFPYAPTINYINHGSSKANVQLRWSPRSISPESLAKDRVQQQQPKGLVLEFVAVRPIREEDEIVLDYGAAWDRAWQIHQQHWRPPTDYVSSTALNQRATIVKDDIPDNLQTHCYLPDQVLSQSTWPDGQVVSQHPKLLRPCEIVEFGKHVYNIRVVGSDNLIDNVPRSVLHFMDRPYTSPQHALGAFRHEIQLSVFPEHWKDQK